MLEGLMQNDYQLTTRHVLERVRRFGADGEVVTLKGEGDVRRAPYPEIAERADRLASAPMRCSRAPRPSGSGSRSAGPST